MAATFRFVFVSMGQGDCCMVRCPDGRVIVVDCGTTANKNDPEPGGLLEAMSTLRGANWAGGQKNTVSALILTHSDEDHYNKVTTFFNAGKLEEGTEFPWSRTALDADEDLARINVDRIYFSNGNLTENTNRQADRPLSNYGTSLSKTIYAKNILGSPTLYDVTINSMDDTKNVRNEWAPLYAYKEVMETPITNKTLTVLKDETGANKWSVSIIAGNVPLKYKGVQSSTHVNARSLITLFQVGKKKALLCGDATFSTEKFLLEAHAKTIAHVDLLKVPHHGSAYASSESFVNTVDPTAAVVSVEFFEHKHFLPRYENVLTPWIARVVLNKSRIKIHDLDYWQTTIRDISTNGMRRITYADCVDYLNKWTNNNTDLSLIDRSGDYITYLKQPAKGVWAFTTRSGGMFLSRSDQVDVNVTSTSQHTQVYDLTATEVKYIERPS